jgi:hypothetical protein
MKANVRSVSRLLALLLVSGCTIADSTPDPYEGIRVLSWNVQEDSFVTHQTEFRALMRRADANIWLLDEVAPWTDADQIEEAILQPGSDATLHIDFGRSGGRQVGVVASIYRLESLQEFSGLVPYPEAERQEILQRMSPADRARSDWSMDGGIPVNAAVILTGTRRLLAVVADLQCCGDSPESWQEFRRMVEVREIRRLVRQVLDRISVDGIILAGDFNLVTSHAPLQVLTGPYRAPHTKLTPVESYHLDGVSNWTWDGRGTPFPSNDLDYQMYDSQALKLRTSLILDSEDLPPEELEQLGIDRKTSSRLSDHRPLLVEYGWR